MLAAQGGAGKKPVPAKATTKKTAEPKQAPAKK
jgi:hypothetical protein